MSGTTGDQDGQTNSLQGFFECEKILAGMSGWMRGLK
jgi:hypothetical protein